MAAASPGGVEDIFIACTDNLTGFSAAIGAVFSKTEIQNCIIHQLRNSSKYIIAPFANGHEVGIRIIPTAVWSKLLSLLFDLIGINNTIYMQSSNRLEPFLSKCVHQLVRCIPAITEKISGMQWFGQFLDDILNDFNL